MVFPQQHVVWTLHDQKSVLGSRSGELHHRGHNFETIFRDLKNDISVFDQLKSDKR